MNQFTFTDKAKKLFIGMIVIGLLSLVYGIMTDDHHGQRVWASALINGWFFFGIGLCGTFFLAIMNVAQAGWGVVVKRVFEAVSMFTPIGGALMFVVLLGSGLHLNHLYHWMDPALSDPTSGHYDGLIANKTSYLNVPFWLTRAVIFIGVYIYFTFLFRKRSLAEDQGGDSNKIFMKNRMFSAIFLIFFGYTSVVASWDWLMSIDAHWFSTLYGWYVFSGLWISGMVVVTLLTIYLKSQGYLKQVNPSHMQDLGKWVFAVSFLWTYLFFSQFMLIWYSDIPEEIVYYKARIEDYPFIFWGMMLINFVLPMLFLMSKDTKRNKGLLAIIGVIIFIGHWVDVWMLITPGAMKDEGHIGITELGMMIGYLGLFLFVVFNQLAKAPLMVKQHAFLDESLHHHQN